jgi:hypothetical protein
MTWITGKVMKRTGILHRSGSMMKHVILVMTFPSAAFFKQTMTGFHTRGEREKSRL